MAAPGLKVSVRLHVLGVSCPGVCLSRRCGELVVRVALLGHSLRTAPAPPLLPLRFDRTFHLAQVFEANDLCELHAMLAAEAVRVELLEAAPTLPPLASFHCSLLTLLFPAPAAAPTLLRMQPAKQFPGVLGPELEVRTWTSVQQVALPSPSSACLRRRLSSVEPAEWRSSSEVRRCARSAHASTPPSHARSASPGHKRRPPFVVRHVHQDIFKLSPPSRRTAPLLSSRLRPMSSLDSHYKTRSEQVCSEHCPDTAECACSVCCLYEEYFGRPYTHHRPAEEDEGVADLLLQQPSTCCCCCCSKSD